MDPNTQPTSPVDEGWALLKKATPGPWRAFPELDDNLNRKTTGISWAYVGCQWDQHGAFPATIAKINRSRDMSPEWRDRTMPDAELIAWAVSNLPWFLDRVAALERERDEAVKAERERCAKIAEVGHLVPPDGGSPTEGEHQVAIWIANQIREPSDGWPRARHHSRADARNDRDRRHDPGLDPHRDHDRHRCSQGRHLLLWWTQ